MDCALDFAGAPSVSAFARGGSPMDSSRAKLGMCAVHCRSLRWVLVAWSALWIWRELRAHRPLRGVGAGASTAAHFRCPSCECSCVQHDVRGGSSADSSQAKLGMHAVPAAVFGGFGYMGCALDLMDASGASAFARGGSRGIDCGVLRRASAVRRVNAPAYGVAFSMTCGLAVLRIPREQNWGCAQCLPLTDLSAFPSAVSGGCALSELRFWRSLEKRRIYRIKCRSMKASQTIISTLRESPSDAVIASHKLMMRAGLIRKLGNGLYAYMPLGLRALRKVENIIRQELDAAGCLEIKPTVVVPGDIWRESGRWDKMNNEMLTAKTRTGQDMVVSPTAEEAFTALIRDGLTSYRQLPLIAYQINTKYRDEIRPRYGVMRGREFIMMDAYSFDADQKSLDESYNKIAAAYRRIFKRMGLSTLSVKADTGAMGGSGSEEFMVESEVGDDTLILCPNCGYAANVEKASCRADKAHDLTGAELVLTDKPIETVDCPGVETIRQMEDFFKMSAEQFIKVLIYKVSNCALDLMGAPGAQVFAREGEGTAHPYYPESFFAVAIRGDLDVSETKLAAVLKATGATLAEEDAVIAYSGAPHGFVGPVGLTKLPLLADESVMRKLPDGSYEVSVHDAVTGGGRKDVDNMHVEPVRDFIPFLTADIRTARAGDKCPDCGAAFYTKKGNELGHIFKLGTKYTASMNVTYLDEGGKQAVPVMGCYGIGLDRTLASIIEEHHDENGILWTMSTCPYQVAVIPIRYDGKMKEVSDAVYAELKNAGIEVLLDDRAERPGVKFKDADLIGFPVRITVGEKTLPNVEIKLRREDSVRLVPFESAAREAEKIVRDALKELDTEGTERT